jgi:hypothetical protein
LQDRLGRKNILQELHKWTIFLGSPRISDSWQGNVHGLVGWCVGSISLHSCCFWFWLASCTQVLLKLPSTQLLLDVFR